MRVAMGKRTSSKHCQGRQQAGEDNEQRNPTAAVVEQHLG